MAIYILRDESPNILETWCVKRQRRIYTLAQRRHIVTLVDRAVQEDGVSFNRAADNLQVSGHSVRRWRVALVALQDPTNPQVCNGAESHHRGPVGFLDCIQEELIAFVTDWRDRGMPVTCFELVRKIGQLKPEFFEKTRTARLMCVLRFLFTNNLVHRDATHSKVAPCSGCPQVRGTNSRSKVCPQCGPDQLEVW